MYGPINLLFFSQILILSEPLLKQYAASSINGVVGKSGINIPITPIPTNKLPNIFQASLLILIKGAFLLVDFNLIFIILTGKNRLNR